MIETNQFILSYLFIIDMNGHIMVNLVVMKFPTRNYLKLKSSQHKQLVPDSAHLYKLEDTIHEHGLYI